MSEITDWIRDFAFASDAARLAFAGAVFWILAGFALIAEKRRDRRKDINRVGFMPWTSLFVFAAVIGGGLLALSVPTLLAG